MRALLSHASYQTSHANLHERHVHTLSVSVSVSFSISLSLSHILPSRYLQETHEGVRCMCAARAGYLSLAFTYTHIHTHTH